METLAPLRFYPHERLPAPEGLVDASLTEAKLSGIDSSFRFSGAVEVSEAGARIGERWLRLGWGAPAPIEPVPQLGGPALDGDAREPRLVCTSTLAPSAARGGGRRRR
jgi:hypothetical protein